MWKDCPDNKWNKNKKEQIKAETAEKKKASGDVHATTSTSDKRKTPVVRIGKPQPDNLEDGFSSDEDFM